ALPTVMTSLRATMAAGLLAATVVLPAYVGSSDDRTADDAIAATVLARLTASLGDASAIEIRVHGNLATLSGTVGDERTRDLAVKEAYSVEGIERVDDRLRVSAPPANPRGM